MTTKADNRDDVVKLEDIPNIGTSIANDLMMIGVESPKQLVGQDPYRLYDKLCEITHVRHDPCVIDCFISAVRFMEGAPKLPWWHYTPERKKHLNNQEARNQMSTRE